MFPSFFGQSSTSFVMMGSAVRFRLGAPLPLLGTPHRCSKTCPGTYGFWLLTVRRYGARFLRFLGTIRGIALSQKARTHAYPVRSHQRQAKSDHKLSDGDGLYLLENQRLNAWRQKYRFAGKEKTLSQAFPEVSEPRRERNAAMPARYSQGENPTEKRKVDKPGRYSGAQHFQDSGRRVPGRLRRRALRPPR